MKTKTPKTRTSYKRKVRIVVGETYGGVEKMWVITRQDSQLNCFAPISYKEAPEFADWLRRTADWVEMMTIMRSTPSRNRTCNSVRLKGGYHAVR